MENNKKETPFVYNLGDRLKYIHSKGEMITVADRRHEYDKEIGATKNIYLLTIENCEGCNYTTQIWASEKYMMANMRRVYSAPKDIITEAFDFTAKYMECREDDNVIKEFFNPEDFEKKSNDALSCGYHETLEEENKKLKNEIQVMKDELKEMKDVLDRKGHEIDIWKNGWYECLKSLGYYLNS